MHTSKRRDENEEKRKNKNAFFCLKTHHHHHLARSHFLQLRNVSLSLSIILTSTMRASLDVLTTFYIYYHHHEHENLKENAKKTTTRRMRNMKFVFFRADFSYRIKKKKQRKKHFSFANLRKLVYFGFSQDFFVYPATIRRKGKTMQKRATASKSHVLTFVERKRKERDGPKNSSKINK